MYRYITLLPRAFFVFNSRLWTSTQDNWLQVRQSNGFMIGLLADEPANWHFIIVYNYFNSSVTELLQPTLCFGDAIISSQETDVTNQISVEAVVGEASGSCELSCALNLGGLNYCLHTRLENNYCNYLFCLHTGHI